MAAVRRTTLNFLSALLPSRRLGLAASLVAFAVAVGTTGYALILDISLVDALYQAVTTLSTVGFREVAPFDTRAKLFTVFLIMFGVGSVLYTLTLVVQEALEGDIRSRFYQRRLTRMIEDLEQHYILCGFGRVGQEIARELRERGQRFVVIEANPDQIEHAKSFGYLVIEGDASSDRSLNLANIRSARALLAASDSDAGNTYITLTAKSMNPACFVVARVASPHNEEKLRLAGADRVISVYSMGGRRMVLSALQPLAADFMDTLAAGRHGDLILAEFEANERNGLPGRTCGDLLSGTRSARLLGIRHRQGTLAIGPPPDAELQEGDIVIVLAEEADLAAMDPDLRSR